MTILSLFFEIFKMDLFLLKTRRLVHGGLIESDDIKLVSKQGNKSWSNAFRGYQYENLERSWSKVRPSKTISTGLETLLYTNAIFVRKHFTGHDSLKLSQICNFYVFFGTWDDGLLEKISYKYGE